MARLSVIIPVYNEENTIKKLIEKVKKVTLRGISKEIIVVDDCSEDNTRDILKSMDSDSLKILLHQKNLGKGAAIRTGIKSATGDIILIQDADLEYNPGEYGRLLKPIIGKKASVVYGSRIDSIKKNRDNMYRLHYIGNQLLTFITNFLYGVSITDMETGYKVFTKDAIRSVNLKAQRFDFEPEVTAKMLKKGYKIHEVPISFFGRKFAEGKKITWVDGVKAAYYLLKYRFFD